MKTKSFLATCLATLAIASVMVIPASAANTSDTPHKYQWSNTTSRYDYTPARHKENATPVYIKTQAYTLPYGGYYAGTYYGTSTTNAYNRASASEYWIGNYTAYTIRANGTSIPQAGKYVRIRGHYADTTYTWGDCTIAWSPDTTNPANYTSLN